ncbi:glycosyltransferase family 2 protein [Acinetobacter faecalis]|uniref:glycosyltransferase family 2 protein n=1 Tax=Acinetobacter faecalis TaxID=2665161 RepID=UPI002A910D85|nr:glycosyltransferase family A protein [Acinetobacter faecalis]MDY6459284.1 glycosyltransferase family A protein [Acinetobacter faecalis]
MSKIKVSIIIPTTGTRFELLQRAIKSALLINEEIEAEVIVVVNGQKRNDFEIKKSIHHPFISYHILEMGNVSNARNYGLSIAKGELIRFLDDDDYLIPEIAYQQYIGLYNSNAGISTYNLKNIDFKFREYPSNFSNKFENGYQALFSGATIAIPLIHVYKKKYIEKLKWNIYSNNGEDFEWLFNVLITSSVEWIFKSDVVGIWFHHENERLSKPYTSNSALKSNVNNMMKLYQKNNNAENIDYYVKGLIFFSRKAFCFDPLYWSKILNYAQSIANKEQNHYFYRVGVHIKVIEWVLLPLKYISRNFKKYIFHSNSHLR